MAMQIFTFKFTCKSFRTENGMFFCAFWNLRTQTRKNAQCFRRIRYQDCQRSLLERRNRLKCSNQRAQKSERRNQPKIETEENHKGPLDKARISRWKRNFQKQRPKHLNNRQQQNKQHHRPKNGLRPQRKLPHCRKKPSKKDTGDRKNYRANLEVSPE